MDLKHRLRGLTHAIEEADNETVYLAYDALEGFVYDLRKDAFGQGYAAAIAVLVCSIDYCFEVGLSPDDPAQYYMGHIPRSQGWEGPPWWVSFLAVTALLRIIEVLKIDDKHDHSRLLHEPLQRWQCSVSPHGQLVDAVEAWRILSLIEHVQAQLLDRPCPRSDQTEPLCHVCGTDARRLRTAAAR